MIEKKDQDLYEFLKESNMLVGTLTLREEKLKGLVI